ncbi:hypothetical protein ACE6H2_008473 [Prunus campanulata]
MAVGILEVMLVSAKGLGDTDLFKQGSSPVWNERFTFRAEYPGSGEQHKVTLKIMDKDTFTADDYIGEATYDLLALGVENGTAQLHPLKYSVVRADRSYRGEIQVGLTFTPRNSNMRDKSLEDGSTVMHIRRETNSTAADELAKYKVVKAP